MEDKRFTGMAGELRVASELLLRGWNPALRYVDEGIDIVLDNNVTIQVKTSITEGYKSRPNSVYICIQKVSYSSKAGRFHYAIKHKADFYIVWLIKKDEFFIIPTKEMKSLKGISITPNKNNLGYYKYKDRWDLLDIKKEK